MTDVIKLAQDKRARLMAEVEGRMAEIERLDGFILFGAKLSAEAAPNNRAPTSMDGIEDMNCGTASLETSAVAAD